VQIIHITIIHILVHNLFPFSGSASLSSSLNLHIFHPYYHPFLKRVNTIAIYPLAPLLLCISTCLEFQQTFKNVIKPNLRHTQSCPSCRPTNKVKVMLIVYSLYKKHL